METCHREEAEKIEEADVMSDDDESVPEEVMTRWRQSVSQSDYVIVIDCLHGKAHAMHLSY